MIRAFGEPRQGESGQSQAFIGAFLAAFVEAEDGQILSDSQVRVCRRPFVQDASHWPGAALIVGKPNGEPDAVGAAGRVGKEDAVAVVTARVGEAADACLANRFRQGGIVDGWAKGLAAVSAPGDGTVVASVRQVLASAAVQIDMSVDGFDGGRFVGPVIGRPADLPGESSVVAENDVRKAGVLAFAFAIQNVVARDDQPAAFKLDAVTRPGRVPRPAGLLDVRGDFAWLAPSEAVVAAGGEPDGSLRATVADCLVVGIGRVFREKKNNGAGAAINDWGGVAAGGAVLGGNDALGAPGATTVIAVAHEEVDLTRVACAVAPALAECQQGAATSGEEPRDAIRVVSVAAGRPQVGLFDEGLVVIR